MKVFLFALAGLVLFAAPVRALEKWIYVSKNLLTDDSVTQIEDLMRCGHAAGYTHLLLADSKLAKLGDLGDATAHYLKNTARVKALAAQYQIEIVPSVFDIGYSNNLLWHDPNLIEALPVRDVPLVVRGGVARVDDPAAPTLPDGEFTDLKKWSWHDADTVTLENGTARMTANGKNARIVQKLAVQPFRQYHVSVRVKTQNLQGAKAEIKVLPDKGEESLNWNELDVPQTQNWITRHMVFNSLDHKEVTLYLGEWGATNGTLWWSHATIEEVAFLNMVRRPGCPLTVATADGKPLTEGGDFEPLSDPSMGRKPWAGSYDVYHEPPALKMRLPDGTRLRAGYFHAVTVNDGQAMVCLSEPKTLDLLRDEARRVHELWGAKGYMMSHDEIRVVNWCEACRQRGLTPGQMVAANVRACTEILRQVNPGGRIYVWSDMFDPNHNAMKGPYYLVNGTLEGSWDGLDKEVIVLPWNYEKRAQSLRYFADRGNRQVIAGYYDDRPGQITDWLDAARGVPGVLGAMYTTWQNHYADLEKFARAVDDAQGNPAPHQ